MTKNSSSSRAPQLRLALNSGTTRRSANNAEKPQKGPSMPSLRNHRGVQTLSMNCNIGNIDHPVRVLHLWYFHSFLHCQTQAPVVVQQRVSQPVQELHLRNLEGLLHSLHCVPVSVKQLNHHSVEELKLRHLHVLDENLLERNCVVTETSTTASATVAAASICIPPWPGGVELLKQGPCFPPPQGFARPRLQEHNRE